MQTVYDSKNRPISLEEEIAQGGEGILWKTNRQGYVAKLYKTPDAKKERKLEIMVANPPENPTVKLNHKSIAWPTDLLKDSHQKFVGFLMPMIQDTLSLPFVYNPKLRKKNCPNFNWKYLHTTAKNIAWIVYQIHDKGYVLGDLKAENLLVNNKALVTVVDTDSFQVRDPKTGQVYHCPVGSYGLTPSELLDKNVSDAIQTKAHDHFRLAIIIYYLLFGQHPFDGEWRGKNDPPGQDDCIRQGHWPYRPNSPIQPSRLTIPLEVVHPSIKDCFIRCFNDGHSNPQSRPTAKEWNNVLEVAIQDLVTCTQVSNHVYSKSYGLSYSRCYWCDRTTNLGSDIFATTPFQQPPSPIYPSQSSPLPSSPSQPPEKFSVGYLIAIFIVFVFFLWVIMR